MYMLTTHVIIKVVYTNNKLKNNFFIAVFEMWVDLFTI